ncbi:MAG: type I-C CRISPR-associated protein Cas8c/Csd1 [Proteobacteria bacterium]|nr:type I-C CRISPR-associated protein Cas8c/Csd1 [Pseudomonadota bacterium]
MSLLAALARAYDRLPDAPPYGYSTEKIGFCVVLNPDGSVAETADLRGDDKKRSPRLLLVPQAVKRTVGIAPNFLWDKSAYVLGVTAGEGKRTAEEHAKFREQHLEWLDQTGDAGLLALHRFLEGWTAEAFAPPLWPEDLRDQNIVFRLSGEYEYLHDRPAARTLWRAIGAANASDPQICLVSGTPGPVARLHPSIKGVWGAQSSGASLISFNLDAFTSYGHEQGDNAPISEAAAFAYTTALNRFLEKDSGHRIQIGDTSTVFWADCEDATVAQEADAWAALMLGGNAKAGPEEKLLEARIRSNLLQMRDGKPLQQIAPHLSTGVRMHLLGLAPNAARLSVRYYWTDSFGTLAQNYAAYLRDVAMEPAPERPVFSIRAAALRSAPAEFRNNVLKYDGDRVSPLLAGELTRAILTGARFPRALLGLLLMRVRSDHVLDRIRISLIKGLIVRDMRLEQRLPSRPDGTPMETYLMRPDPEDPNVARRLGRLFALIERAQLAALGDGINATVKDKFLGPAAATPGRVFPSLLMNAENHHLKRLRNGHSDADWIKDAAHARAVGAGLNRDIGELWASLERGAPAQHSLEEQGLFLVGYYQERFVKRDESAADAAASPEEHESEE